MGRGTLTCRAHPAWRAGWCAWTHRGTKVEATSWLACIRSSVATGLWSQPQTHRETRVKTGHHGDRGEDAGALRASWTQVPAAGSLVHSSEPSLRRPGAHLPDPGHSWSCLLSGAWDNGGLPARQAHQGATGPEQCRFLGLRVGGAQNALVPPSLARPQPEAKMPQGGSQ